MATEEPSEAVVSTAGLAESAVVADDPALELADSSANIAVRLLTTLEHFGISIST